jgi:hypothetical protein
MITSIFARLWDFVFDSGDVDSFLCWIFVTIDVRGQVQHFSISSFQFLDLNSYHKNLILLRDVS